MSDAILDFVMERQAARARHESPRCWGASSDAMVLYALGKGPRPQTPGRPTNEGGSSWHGEEVGRDYPHDEDDLAACERTYEMAPIVVQITMLPVLTEFRAWVREGLNRYGEPSKRTSGAFMSGPGFDVHIGVLG